MYNQDRFSIPKYTLLIAMFNGSSGWMGDIMVKRNSCIYNSVTMTIDCSLYFVEKQSDPFIYTDSLLLLHEHNN